MDISYIKTHLTEMIQKYKWVTLSPLSAVKRSSNVESVKRVHISTNTHAHKHTRSQTYTLTKTLEEKQ